MWLEKRQDKVKEAASEVAHNRSARDERPVAKAYYASLAYRKKTCHCSGFEASLQGLEHIDEAGLTAGESTACGEDISAWSLCSAATALQTYLHIGGLGVHVRI